MKKLMILVFLLLIGWVGEAKSQDFTLKSGFSSKYLNKAGIVLFPGPIWVENLTVAEGDFYGEIVTFNGIERSTSLGNNRDEVDIGGGVRPDFGWVKLDVELSYYMLSRLDHSNDDRWVFDIRADFSRCRFVRPYVAVRYFGRMTNKIPDGWFVWVGAKHTEPLHFLPSFTDKPITVTVDVSAAASDGALGRSPGMAFYRLGLVGDIPLTKSMSASASVLAQFPSETDRHRIPSYTTREMDMVFALLITKHF